MVSGAGERPAKATSPVLGLRLLGPPPRWRAFARRASQCSKKAHGDLPHVMELCPCALSAAAWSVCHRQDCDDYVHTML